MQILHITMVGMDKYDSALKAEIKQLFKGVSKYRYTTPDAQTARINYEL